jgi:hypothetical protein
MAMACPFWERSENCSERKRRNSSEFLWKKV